MQYIYIVGRSMGTENEFLRHSFLFSGEWFRRAAASFKMTTMPRRLSILAGSRMYPM